jgi:acetyl esterase
LAAHIDHPITHLLAKDQPHAFLQACGNDRSAEEIMAQIADWIWGLVKV